MIFPRGEWQRTHINPNTTLDETLIYRKNPLFNNAAVLTEIKTDEHITHLYYNAVGHVIKSQTFNNDGVELFTRELLNNLPEDIFNTVLIPSDQAIAGLTNKITYLNSTTRIINYQFINQIVSTKIGNRNADLFHEKLDTMFIRILMSGQYKVVHFHSFVGLGSLLWPHICHYFGIKTIISCHDHYSICFNF